MLVFFFFMIVVISASAPLFEGFGDSLNKAAFWDRLLVLSVVW